MKLALVAAALFALAHATPQTTPAHPYAVPNCHGIAQVPGYETCQP